MRDPKATAAPPATLPEDVVLEILARVPDVADLFRCAVACKRWRTLVADRPFLRRRWPDDARHPSSLLGFFGQEWGREGVPAPLPDFVRAPQSVLGHGRPYDFKWDGRATYPASHPTTKVPFIPLTTARLSRRVKRD